MQTPTRFGFTDLHSFKDYVGYVKLCAPDEFPFQDWHAPDDQMNLGLAFDGLRLGLKLATAEKGERLAFAEAQKLVEDAYIDYREGRPRDGFSKLAEVQKLLRKVPTR